MSALVKERFSYLESEFGYSPMDYGLQNRIYRSSRLEVNAFFWDKYTGFDVQLKRPDKGEVIGISALMLIKDVRFFLSNWQSWHKNDEKSIQDFSFALKAYGTPLLRGDFAEWKDLYRLYRLLLKEPYRLNTSITDEGKLERWVLELLEKHKENARGEEPRESD